MSRLGRRTVTTVRLIETAHDGFQLAEEFGVAEAADLAETLVSAAVIGLRHREVQVPQEVHDSLERLVRLVRGARHRRIDDDDEAGHA